MDEKAMAAIQQYIDGAITLQELTNYLYLLVYGEPDAS